MTRQQFNRAFKLSRAWCAVWILCLAALLVYLSLRVGAKFEHWFNIHDWAEFSWIGLTLLVFITGALCIARMIYRHYQLACPSCGEWIDCQPRMLKTGKCPRCKSEMFSDGAKLP